ncbi:MAG: IPT/TIG domain-containing protein, partial [Pseudonocardiaceae bacterium]
VISPTQITTTTPAHTAGPAQVTVTTPCGGTSTNLVNFIYAAAPTVTSVTPNNGPASGGTPVLITGTNLTGTTTVTFGGTPAPTFTVVNPTQIFALTPPDVAGPAQVVVTTACGGTSTDLVDFTYTAAPTVTSVTPNDGTTDGGDTVIIDGANFTGTTSVTFGGTPALFFIVASVNQVQAITPPHAAGPAQVVVTTAAGGSSTDVVTFTYTIGPVVTTLIPDTGPAAGGTSVTIAGDNFTGATSVTFGGIPATSFTVDAATQITATAPAHAVGPAQVVVTTPSGTSTDPVDFLYT